MQTPQSSTFHHVMPGLVLWMRPNTTVCFSVISRPHALSVIARFIRAIQGLQSEAFMMSPWTTRTSQVVTAFV